MFSDRASHSRQRRAVRIIIYKIRHVVKGFTRMTLKTDDAPWVTLADLDNVFNTSYDRAAVSAHVNATKTYDFFKNRYGRNSYDNYGRRAELDGPLRKPLQ